MKKNRIKNAFLHTNWESVLEGNPEEAWNGLKLRYHEVIEANIPWKTVGEKGKPKWMTRGVQKAVKKKRKLWRRYKLTGRRELHDRFTQVNSETKQKIKAAKEDFESKLASNIKGDPKSFFAYARGNQRTRASVGSLQRRDGTLANSDRESAEILNEQFCSVFTREDTFTLPVPVQMFTGPEEEKLLNLEFTAEAVKKKLDALKPNKAPGPDMIHPRILKEFSAELAPGLARLFEKSLQNGVVPNDWKAANVVPLHKGGSKKLAMNYRPVSLTSVVCKMFESLIKDRIVTHLREYQLLNKSQHGFLPGRSCLTNLLTFLEDITRVIDESISVDAIYLDFAKAFNKVPHQRLAAKFRAHGIEGDVLQWITEWLRGRRQVVSVNGSASEEVPVLSGVPQGSVLGPILFLIFVNDMDEGITSHLLKFADDTKLYLPLRNDESHAVLQEDLNKLCKWLMLFNVSKCATLHFGYNNPRHAYYMSGNAVNRAEETKDLGVCITSNLKPSHQCIAAAKKANRVLGMVYRNIQHKSPKIIKKLYLQLVRPIWSMRSSRGPLG
jgi:hypothetical protein